MDVLKMLRCNSCIILNLKCLNILGRQEAVLNFCWLPVSNVF